MKDPGYEKVFELYDKGVQFNQNIELYENVENNENFYIGKQWEGVQANGNALDAAIQETMKPTQELDNLNNAIDGLFAQNKTAQADIGAESTNVNTNPDSMPKVTMADFTDRLSAVFNNLEYGDTKTQTEITQKTHQDMVSSGEVVKIPESTLEQTESYYPDLRGMKKQERAPILKQKITELKTVLRKFLNGMKGGTYEFEVNGNILEAKLYDTGVREVMDKITQNKASMLLHSEEVFKNARYLYSTPDYEGDPNIYRWNYFYTPVDIGGETVGVRIAVRDIALGQNNIPESQIYNWNIKKDAALGGEKLGTNAASPDTSSAASDNNSIRGNSENVNGKSNLEQAVDSLFPGLNENTADKLENVPEWAKPTVQKLVNRDILMGDENGNLNLSYDMTRMLVILDRAGVFG